MKYTQFILLIIFLSIGINANSQPHEKMKKIKALKIGFITESLELTPDEATEFWPIYNLHQDKIHQLYHQNRRLRHSMKGDQYFEDLTDKDAENILNDLLKMNKIIEQEKSTMFEKLKTILPAKKLLKLYKVENDFNRKMLEQYRKHREGTKK